MTTRLEHINISVPDARATAEVLGTLFGWETRWEGDTPGKGYSVHVGTGDSYIALYSPGHAMSDHRPKKYTQYGGLNHIGLTVDDLDAAEAKVRAAGYMPHLHADYEPGRRFYFDGPDGVEYEIVSYA
ncbi:VOC family protein [Marivita hallyeonensis]|uniref:Catechol 2,3-dioxygenase n=1 Tax=Marivita hallyeonensis TaxID=996342 RepID=A0A1M5R9N3_9RHOB|nr:VOC family protein [Marivita hallyeonensis]SHH22810.1 Catechol 2,3-dioxygenase [Marivita hallyeonensis]